MSSTGSVKARLDAARQRAFVGREGVIDLFRQGVEAEEPPFVVLFVHGPGGVGKTTLLRRLALEARAADVRLVELDGHAMDVKSEAVLRALGASSLDELMGRDERLVVTIDTYELLAPLDAWIRDRLAPALPAGAILVLAGREPPSADWRVDPGWASLLASVALDNFGPEESARLLEARGVDEELRGAIHELTYGHPLALALVADVMREGGERPRRLTPNVVGTLLDSLLRAVPTEQHREALSLAALARLLTRPLLSKLVGDDDGSLYEWLARLSFIERTAEGLYMHDLVRDVLILADEERDAVVAEERRKAIGMLAAEDILNAPPERRDRAALNLIHVFRGNPDMKPYFDWQTRFGGSSRAMREEELPILLELAREHEGEAAERLARRYHAERPESFIALESADGHLGGFLVYLRLDEDALDAERARDDADPALEAVGQTIAQHGPLREGEHAGVLRFWLWRDGYQDLGSPTHVAHSRHVLIEWSTARGLGPALVVVQRADVWDEFLTGIDFNRVRDVPEADPIRIGGRTFHLFMHDFRVRPAVAWLAGTKSDDARPAVILGRDAFADAVRAALRACAGAPDQLASSPLLGSRLLAEWAEDETPTPAMIREVLEVAVSSLADERDERPRRAVEVTYLKGAPTQEAAAERLGLSFSTYRRALAKGVDGAIDWLWARETSAG